MNHIYRLKRSGRSQQLQPVPETARSAGKGQSLSPKALARAVANTMASVVLASVASLGHAQQAPPAAKQLPQGGVVSRGSASIVTNTAAAQMTVNQTSARAVIDWASFNVGSQAKVQFNQPDASAVALNQVQGNNASQIYGQISANGQVILANPNGIFFSPTASVDVGSLVATTGKAHPDDFMAGQTRFSRDGSTGSVVNQGQLKAAMGGYIALLAPEVRNQGVVIAQAGTVALATGEAITLNFNNGGTSLAGLTTTPQAIAALVDNQSAVLVEGGQIILSAHALASLQNAVVKNSGQLSASSLSEKGGKIVLMADKIELTGTSKIEANGLQGGGTVLVGGDWQGGGDMRQATQVSMAPGASIEANATQNGDGGKVVLWSDVHNTSSITQVDGRIEVKGAGAGRGGQVETSGHTLLVGDRLTVNTLSSGQGTVGQWLLDPADIDINSSGTEAGSTYNSGTRTIAPNSGVATSIISPSTIQGALGSGNVTVTTTNTSTAGAGTGNITVTSNVAWTSGNSLTLIASGGLSGAGNITTGTSASNLTIQQAGNSTYSGAIGGAGSVTKTGGGALTLSGANIYSGGTTVSQGTLTLGANEALGSGSITVNGGTLGLGTYSQTAAAVNIGSSGGTISSSSGVLTGTGYTVNNNSSATISAILAGSGAFTKSGTGTLTISGNNTYTGATQINAGFVSVQHANAFGSGASDTTLETGATLLLQSSLADNLVLNGGTIKNFTGTNTISGNLDLRVNTSFTGVETLTVSGSISGTAGIIKNSNDVNNLLTLVLSGNNSYQGPTTLNSGTLKLGSNTALGATSGVSASYTTFGSSYLAAQGTLDLNGFSVADNIPFSLKGYLSTYPLLINSSNTAVSYAGLLSLDGNVAVGVKSKGAITLSNTGTLAGINSATLALIGAGTLNSVIGSTVGNLIVNGGASDTWVLTRDQSYTGTTTIAGGSLQVGDGGATGSLPSGSTITLSSSLSKLAYKLSAGAAGLSVGNTIVSTSASGASLVSAIANLGYGSVLDLTGATLTVDAVTYTVALDETTATPSVAAIKMNNPAFGSLAVNVLTSGSNTSFSGISAITWTGSATGAPAYKVNGNHTVSGVGEQWTKNANDMTLSHAGLWSISLNNGSTTTSYTTTTSAADFAFSSKGIVTIAPGASVTLSGLLSGGSSGLLVQGGGTLTLNNANTYTGSTTISAGVVKIGSATALSSGPISVTSGAALDLNGQTMTSTGALTLNGTGVSSGGALMNSSGVAATYAGLVTLGSAATIKADTGAITLSNTGNITGAYALTLDGAAGGTVSSSLVTSTGALIKNGTGTWVLGKANSYTGATSVNAGVLKAGSYSPFGPSGTVTVSSGAAIDLNGQNITSTGPLTLNGTGIASGGALFNSSATGATYSGLITLGSDSSVVGEAGTIWVSNSGTISGGSHGLTLGGAAGGSLSSIVSSTTASLTKVGSGSWTLYGVNTLSGGTTVSAGKLQVGNANAFGTGAVTVANGAFIDLYGYNVVNAGVLTLNGTGVSNGGALVNNNIGAASYSGLLQLGSAASIVSNNGNITLGNTGSITGAGLGLTLGGSATGSSIAGSIDTGTGAVTKQGSGAWTLNGASTYSGGTSVSAGTLKAGSATAFGSGTINVTSTGKIDINGQTMTSTGGLTLNNTNTAYTGLSNSSSTTAATFAGLVTLQAHSVVDGGTQGLTLSNTGTIVGNNKRLLLYGNGHLISNLNTSISELTKDMAGTWTVSGNNTYSSGTYVSAGTLKAGSATAFGTSIISVRDRGVDAALDLNGWTLTNPGTLYLRGPGVSGGGALMNSGADATYPGPVVLWAASSIVGGTGAITLSNAGNITGNTFGLTLGGAAGGSISSNIATTTGSLTKEGSGIWTLSGNNTYSGGTSINAGTLVMGAANALGTAGTISFGGGTLRLFNTTDHSARFSNAANQAYALDTNGQSVSLSSNLTSVGGSLTKSGSGTLTLSGTNTYDGATSVNAGALVVINASGLGTSAAGTSVATGAMLDLQGVAVGAEALTLNGTLKTSTGTSSLSGNVILGAGSTVDVGGTQLTLSGVVSGAELNKTGAGILVLSGTNTYSGGTNINAGTLALGSSDALGSSGTISFGGGTLRLFDTTDYSARFSTAASQAYTLDTNGQNMTLASNLTSVGATLTKLGGGTLTLTGSNTFTGGASINAGTLALGSADALGSSGTISFGGGNLRLFDTTDFSGRFSNAANQTYALDTNGQNVALASDLTSVGGSLTKSGIGTLTLTGNNTYTGATTVNGGTLSIAADSALGAVPISATAGSLTLDGGTLAATETMTLSSNRGITLGTGNGTIDVTSGKTLTYGGSVAGSSLTKTGAGTLLLSGPNTFSGATHINAGTLAVTNVAGLGSSAGGTTVAAGATLDLQNVAVTAEPVTLNGGTLKTSTGSSSLGGDVALGANSTVDVSATQLTLGGVVSGAGDLSKSGSGTLALSGANTYSGVTTVNAGTLQLGDSGNTGNPGSGTVRLNAGVGDTATLALNGVSISNAIESTGAGGTQVVTSLSSAAPATLSGAVDAGAAGIRFSTAANASLYLNGALATGSQTQTFVPASGGEVRLGGPVSGTGTLQQNGAGVLSLAGDNSGGNFTLAYAPGNTGTIRLANSHALGSGNASLSVPEGATLALGAFDGSNLSIVGKTLSLEGSQTDAGGGALRNVAGDNSWAGAVNLNHNSSVTVNTGATLSLSSSASTLGANSRVYFNLTNGDLNFGALTGTQASSAYQLTGSGALAGTISGATATATLYARLYDSTGLYTSVYGDSPVYGLGFYTAASGGSLVNPSQVNYSGTPVFTGLPTSSSNATTYSVSYVSGLTVSGLIYTLAGAGDARTWTVTPKAVTLTNTARSTTYDGTSSYGSLASGTAFTNSALVGSDVVASVTQTASGAGVTPAGVAKAGGFTVTPSSAVMGSGLAGNYSFSYVPSTHTVNPAPLTVTFTAANKAYDGNTTASLSSSDNRLGSDVLTVSATGNFADKNVGTGKTVTVSGVSLSGADANNYTVSATGNTTTGNITRLPQVSWVGGTSGNWFDSANWAGGAVPDLANVASVTIPSGVTVNFGTAVVAPAQAGAVSLDALGTAGTLTMSGGTLNVGSGGVMLGSLLQSGGSLSSAGAMAVNSLSQTAGTLTASSLSTSTAYSQTGLGTVSVTGPVQIMATAAPVVLGNLSTTDNLSVNSTGGTITQSAGTALLVAGASTLSATSAGQPADVILANAGNALTGTVTVAASKTTVTGASDLVESLAKPSLVVVAPVQPPPSVSERVYEFRVLKLPDVGDGFVQLELKGASTDWRIPLPQYLQTWLAAAKGDVKLVGPTGHALPGVDLLEEGRFLGIKGMSGQRLPDQVVLQTAQARVLVRLVKTR